MRFNEIITEDIDRRGFLGGLLGAAATGAFGTQKSTSQPQSKEPTSAQNRGDMAMPVKGVQSAPTVDPQPQKVIPKYSPAELKKYIIDYARKYLPQNQVLPFIAQVAHESHDFRSMEENLNYSSAGALTRQYPNSFPKDVALRIINYPRKAEIIANQIYGNRMGNNEPGDGYKYRGRGYIMLTGKENYEKMGRSLNIDLVNNPDLAVRPDYAAQIAVMYWKTRVANKGNTNNVAQVTKRISGSDKQGIESRREKLKQYTRELGKKSDKKRNDKSK